MVNHLKRAVCLLLAILLCLLSHATPAIAQELPPFHPTPAIATPFFTPYSHLAFLRWLFGRRPKEDDRPARTVSAGRRGKCSDVSQAFVGLVPPEETPAVVGGEPTLSTTMKSFVGFTSEAFPSLWFHIPALPPDVESLELMVQDAGNTDLMNEPLVIPLSGTPGVYPIDWHISEVPLEVGQAYHWYLSILCNAERPSRNPSIDAWVQRVALTPAIARSLTTATERERIELYIEDGLWHDALTQLAKLRCQRPNDPELTDDWITLLNSVGVADEVAIAPIAQCPT